MALTQKTKISMELAEFIAKIVLDVSDGVNGALRLQEERQVEMAASASLDPLEFARLAVSEEELDRELARLFPGADAQHAHSVYVGAPYYPALREGDNESPPFQALLGIKLERNDYVRSRGSKIFVLGKTAVEKIRGAVHARLGAESQNILRSALGRGVPRVIVDSGKARAKITLSLEAAVRYSLGAANMISVKGARLLVRMVDDRAPQNQQLRVDNLSELEITFKTVT